VEEVNLQQGVVPMTNRMLTLYSLLTDVKIPNPSTTREEEEEPEAKKEEKTTGTTVMTKTGQRTDAQYWLSVLKMLAMRSLSHMMLHADTAILALQYQQGKMLQKLMSSALKESCLTSYVDLRRLEYRCRVLHRRVLESSETPDSANSNARGNAVCGTVWHALEDGSNGNGMNGNGEESAKALEERLRREARAGKAKAMSEMMVGYFDTSTLP
jgi:hypothetical protein